MSKSFCSAPFVHMYLHKNQGPRVCCIASNYDLADSRTETNLQKRWKGKYYQRIRQQLLDGKQPKECTKCYSLEAHGGESDRLYWNREYEDTLEPDVVNGNQFNTPIDLDLRPGNLCNLKCRMCGPSASSQIQKEIGKNKLVAEVYGSADIYEPVGLFEGENLDFLLDNIDRGKRIKFLGGEPTLMPEVEAILDRLIENGMIHIPINFTTNLTNNTDRFVNKIRQFSNVHFNYSIDGTGKVVEYIRHPVKFKAINTNIKLYEEISYSSMIQFTFQAYNFFNLYDMIKWAISLDIGITIEQLDVPEFASVLCIPKTVRDKELNRLKTILSNFEHPQLSAIIDRLLDDDREYGLEEITRKTKLLDTARNEHIKDSIPELWKILKGYYNATDI